ncbi:MAG: DUF748 domain-containing protein [Candidatus Omnitrophica bacterium]|nr:DUF748 domain-containing protein [Candidatus Omnitrophota bacterium]
MFKKICNITLKIFLGLFVFYTVVGFTILPAVIKWAVASQGTAILKHEVRVRSVDLNPFTFRLRVAGFEVLDKDSTVMAGFERFTVDLSFLALFKKVYRVESLTLDGLRVNVALLPGGKVNLLELVPPVPAAPQAPSTSVPKPAATPVSLPLVVVDDIKLNDGAVAFTDKTLTPVFKTSLHAINIHITGLSTKPDGQAKVMFEARLDEKGVISSETDIKPLVQPVELETSFSLNGYAMNTLTPYVGKFTGRSLADGNMNFKMDYRISNNKLTASHKVLIQRFAFGQKVESRDALPLPFGLVVALLEDADGRINVSLPVTGDMSSPEFHYWGLVGQVVRNFFFGIVAKPFAFLASALGAESGNEELGYVRFTPGKADIADAEKEKMRTLMKGLKARPKLLLAINGSYAADVDWKAIQKDVVDRDFADMRQKSSRTDSRVYQDLYQRRFGIQALWNATKKFKQRQGAYDDKALEQELRRQLIEEGDGDKVALALLAKRRAEAVHAFMLAEGFDERRVSVGPVAEVQASMGFVPSEFTLTIFESDKPSEAVKPATDVPAGK